MTVKAWSYSRYSTHDKCPRRYKYQVIDRLDQGPKGKAPARGIEVHEQAEAYLKAKRKPKKIPAALSHFTEMFAKLRKQRVSAEHQMAFTQDWQPTEWFGDKTWVRVVVDAMTPKRIIDFKTGKIYPREHEQQLELYAIAGFLLQPEAEIITAEAWYLDSGDCTELDFHREELPELMLTWEQRVRPMFDDTAFEPNPSRLCGWCPFSGKKNGPCDAG